tara:strand:- start:668 stop:2911 length:2244 start_codon:yes stop_codon:yes gene_type:complete
LDIQNKSILAKLLAAENVTLKHRNVPTASFDLKSRTLTLPIWEEMSVDLYDLFIGHEVGHALFTPMMGWHDNVMEYGPAFKSFLNVIEDARIERKIKSKFPGLVRSFHRGYSELFEKDFFGVTQRDISTLGLIDRINLHFKIGGLLGVPFSETEQQYIPRIEAAESWEDVVVIAEELFDEAKTSQEEPEQAQTQTDPEFGDSDEGEQGESVDDGDEKSEESQYDESGDASGDEESESDSESGGKGEDDSESPEQETPEQESTSGSTPNINATEDNGSQDPISETDTAFRENEGSLVSDTAKENAYVEWVSPKIENWVFPIHKTWANVNWENAFRARRNSFDASPTAVAQKMRKNFDSKNKAVINQLVQRFEMKRKASTLSRARTNKTGELNMKKLWATKLTEDVFLSNTVVPNGTNHGMMMFIDFSGSMIYDINATILQTLVMAEFCKKVNIPFEIYSFTNAVDDNMPGRNWDQMTSINNNWKDGTTCIKDDNFYIVQLMTSDLSPNMYKKTFTNMLLLAESYNRKPSPQSEYWSSNHELPACLSLGGTPLLEAILVARELVKRFKRNHKIEKMNTLFLTDGDPTGELHLGSQFQGWSWQRDTENVYISDNGVTTQYKVNRRESTRTIVYNALLKHFKASVDTTLVNFHIGNFKSYEISRRAGGYENDAVATAALKSYRQQKFAEIRDTDGFDLSYLIKNGDNLSQEDLEMEVKSDKKGDILRGFKKFQSKKSGNSLFLGKFIDLVA